MILGASTDSVEKQRKFKQKYKLPFTLLADPAHLLAEACGVWGPKVFMGKKYMGVTRSTVIIGPDGTVARVFEKVTPLGHAREVAQAIEDLKRATSR